MPSRASPTTSWSDAAGPPKVRRGAEGVPARGDAPARERERRDRPQDRPGMPRPDSARRHPGRARPPGRRAGNGTSRRLNATASALHPVAPAARRRAAAQRRTPQAAPRAPPARRARPRPRRRGRPRALPPRPRARPPSAPNRRSTASTAARARPGSRGTPVASAARRASDREGWSGPDARDRAPGRAAEAQGTAAGARPWLRPHGSGPLPVGPLRRAIAHGENGTRTSTRARTGRPPQRTRMTCSPSPTRPSVTRPRRGTHAYAAHAIRPVLDDDIDARLRCTCCGTPANRSSLRSMRPGSKRPTLPYPPFAAFAAGRLILRHHHELLEQHRPRVHIDEPALPVRRLRLGRSRPLHPGPPYLALCDAACRCPLRHHDVPCPAAMPYPSLCASAGPCRPTRVRGSR